MYSYYVIVLCILDAQLTTQLCQVVAYELETVGEDTGLNKLYCTAHWVNLCCNGIVLSVKNKYTYRVIN